MSHCRERCVQEPVQEWSQLGGCRVVLGMGSDRVRIEGVQSR